MICTRAKSCVDGPWIGAKHARDVKYICVFTTACGEREMGPIGRVGSRGPLRKSKNHEKATVEGSSLPRRIYRGEIRRFIEAVRGS